MSRPVEALAWPEPLQPQDLVITLLGSYVRPFHSTVWSGGLVALLGEFGFSMGAARIALARLVRRGLIARVRDGRLVHYTITPRAEHVLAEGDLRIFSFGREDHSAEVWTVLWHAIPEERRLERGRLGRRLRFLGFGSVQDGTWVSPHDREDEVSELLAQLDVADQVGLLVGRSARALHLSKLVERAWDLDALAERYRTFAEEFGPYRSRRAQKELDDRGAFLLRTRLVHLFRGFPFLDPDLPDEHMLDPEHRAAAVEIFHELYAALAEPSQRHFDLVTSAYAANGQLPSRAADEREGAHRAARPAADP